MQVRAKNSRIGNSQPVIDDVNKVCDDDTLMIAMRFTAGKLVEDEKEAVDTSLSESEDGHDGSEDEHDGSEDDQGPPKRPRRDVANYAAEDEDEEEEEEKVEEEEKEDEKGTPSWLDSAQDAEIQMSIKKGGMLQLFLPTDQCLITSVVPSTPHNGSSTVVPATQSKQKVTKTPCIFVSSESIFLFQDKYDDAILNIEVRGVWGDAAMKMAKKKDAAKIIFKAENSSSVNRPQDLI